MNFNKPGKVFTSKFIGTGPSSYKKGTYWAAVSSKLRTTAIGLHGLLRGRLYLSEQVIEKSGQSGRIEAIGTF
jgi:hypothetical protein